MTQPNHDNTRAYFDPTPGSALTMRHHYEGQIDFNESARHLNWRIMTVIPVLAAPFVSRDLIDRGILKVFDMGTRPLISFSQMALTFGPRKLDIEGNKHTRRKLLKYLDSKQYKIRWKEDNHGYEIDGSGHIVRKWILGSVASERTPKVPRPIPLIPRVPSQFQCQLALPASVNPMPYGSLSGPAFVPPITDVTI